MRRGHGIGHQRREVWIDVDHPTLQEKQLIEAEIGITLPEQADMREIEPSSRLYLTPEAVYMTATHLLDMKTDHPSSTPVAYILTPRQLVTVRYAEPVHIRLFASQAGSSGIHAPELIFISLMEVAINCRAGYLLEQVNAEYKLDQISSGIFQVHRGRVEKVLQALLIRIGHQANISSRVRESLVDKYRLLNFADRQAGGWTAPNARQRLNTTLHDAQALSEHASFMEDKITFLQDATLGTISIEQNRVIKIFSIVAVIFMPPTLVASIYGMNFKNGMIELDWRYGYPYALALMVVSVVCTLWFFRNRRWL